MSEAERIVYNCDGTPAYLISSRFLTSQNRWSKLPNILEAHTLRIAILKLMTETISTDELRSLAKDIREIDFEIQRLWGFPEDEKHHKFWELPGCACPKTDNQDAYPYESYYGFQCRIHGVGE